MQITYIIESLSNSGGLERVISQKANWLANYKNYKITIITFVQRTDDDDFFDLDGRVNRVRWEIYSSHFPKDLFGRLREWLACNPQDICISTYGREFKCLYKINDNSKKIVEFHFCHDVNKHWCQQNKKYLLYKILGWVKTKLMEWHAKQYDKIVVLTNDDVNKWNSDKVICIPNPVTIPQTHPSDCDKKRVLALGRMDKQKGFDYLIKSWSLIEKKYNDWFLDIYGSGDSEEYKQLISDLGLKNVKISGAIKDVTKAYLESSIYVLSSRYEGFSLTICEAMNCGLPIVSFNCPSGPSDLIENGVNGYLINNVGDIKSMAKCLSELMENHLLRRQFGQKSYEMGKKYVIDTVMHNWVNLFEGLLPLNS